MGSAPRRPRGIRSYPEVPLHIRSPALVSCALALALAAGLTGCGASPDPEVRIGTVAILSGAGGAGGRSTVYGARLAVEAANARGPVIIDGRPHRVALVEADSRGVPGVAMSEARRLINQDSVVALVGLNRSQLADAVANLAENARIPMITTGATDPGLTAGRDFVFSTVFDDPFQGQVMAEFAFDELGARRASVLLDATLAYSRRISEIFRSRFEARGGTVVTFESYTPGGADFRGPLERVAAAGADVLLLPNYEPELTIQIRQAADVMLPVTLLGSDSWSQVSASQADGAYYVNTWHPETPSARSRETVQAYRGAFDEDPSPAAMAAYDAVEILVSIMEAAGSAEPEVLRGGLAGMSRYEGVSGTMMFGGGRGTRRSAVVVRVGGGASHLQTVVEPPAEGSP